MRFALLLSMASVLSGCGDESSVGNGQAAGSSGTVNGGSYTGGGSSGGANTITGGAGGAAGTTNPGPSMAGATGGDGAAGATPGGPAVRLFSLTSQQVDVRFPVLPMTLPVVRLLPNSTFQADVDAAVKSVRFTVDGKSLLDVTPPFRFGDDAEGAPLSWTPSVGEHAIAVETFTTADGSGAPTGKATHSLALTAKGADATPDQGQHQVHRVWVTGTGDYLHRDATSAFVNAAGNVVLKASDVTTETRGTSGVHLVTPAGKPTIEFAFILLLPDGFDPDVEYPLLTVLHHGGENYRGTDSSDDLLQQPPLVGDRSLVSSPLRNKFPAIIFVPQLPFWGDLDGVSQQWAAFTSLDGGFAHSAPMPAIGARAALKVIDDLLAAKLEVGGKKPRVDKARLYITGHSMGGLGTWDLVERQPNFWAAAVPMAGYPDHDRAAAVVNTPIWAFSHRLDCYNKFPGIEKMFELVVQTHGGKRMKLSAMDFDTQGACDQAHFQTPDRAFRDEKLMPWLFAQVNDRQ